MKADHYIKALKETGEKPHKAYDFTELTKRALNVTESPEPAMMMADTLDPPPAKDSWGFHLLINGSSCNDKIDSEDDIKAFFKKLLKKLGMKELTPIVVKRVDSGEEGRGISAFQMITTSHFAMHFDDDKRSAYIDIFSCKTFEPDPVVAMVKEHFQPKTIVSQMIYRDAGLRKGKSDGNTQ